MSTTTRYALLSCSILAVLALDPCLPARAATASETAVAPPDFSGVWLPDSKASGRWPDPRPFTPAMTELRAQWAKATGPIDLTRDDEHTSCLPYTLPYMMTTITQYPFEIVSTPRRLYIFTEVYGQVRRIDIDGAPVSPETLPSRTGVSRAHWEGSQLVIETTKILPEGEGSRYPGSPALRVVERLSLVNGANASKQLVNEVTMQDPQVYREPITIRMVYKSAAPGIEVGEYICNQDLWDAHRDGTSSKIPWR